MGENIDYSKKNILKNSIWSFVYKVCSMTLSFISAPLILRCLGEEKYGIWITIGSMISWIYYSDLGIGSGLRNKLTTSLAKNDEKTSRGYIAVSYMLLSIISVVFFVVFFIVIKVVDITKIFNLYSNDESIRTCLILALLFSCINFIFSIVNNIIYAKQRASLVSFFNLVGQALFVLTLFIYQYTGIRLIIYIAIGEGLCQVAKNIVATAYVVHKYPELRVSIIDVDRRYSKGILSFGILVFVSQISSLIHNTTDNLLISYLFGAADVTPYNFCFKYFGMINNLYLVLLTPLLSAYTAAKTVGDNKWIERAMKKSMQLYVVFFVGTLAACFIFKPFAKIWLGEELNYSNGLILFTAMYYLILMLSHNTTSLQTGFSDLKMATVAVALGAILNIPASIIFAQNFGFGVTGIVIGSVISMIPTIAVGLYKYVYYLRRFSND